MRIFSLVLIGLSALPAFATQPYAYVTNAVVDQNGNPDSTRIGRAVVLNWQTRQVIKTIAVGKAPTDVVAHPNGKFVYVANAGDNSISIIGTDTNQVIGTIKLGPSVIPGSYILSWLAILPDGKFLYAANSENFSAIDVVSTETNKVVSTVQTGNSNGFYRLVASPDGKFIYSLQEGLNAPDRNFMTVTQIDTVSNAPLGSVSFDGGNGTGWDLAITPDGSWLYFPSVFYDYNQAELFVDLIEISTHPLQMHKDYSGLRFADGLTVSNDGKQLYMTSYAPMVLGVFNRTTKQEIRQIGMAASGGRVFEAPDSKTVFAIGTDTISIASTGKSYEELGHITIKGLVRQDALAFLALNCRPAE